MRVVTGPRGSSRLAGGTWRSGLHLFLSRVAVGWARDLFGWERKRGLGRRRGGVVVEDALAGTKDTRPGSLVLALVVGAHVPGKGRSCLFSQCSRLKMSCYELSLPPPPLTPAPPPRPNLPLPAGLVEVPLRPIRMGPAVPPALPHGHEGLPAGPAQPRGRLEELLGSLDVGGVAALGLDPRDKHRKFLRQLCYLAELLHARGGFFVPVGKTARRGRAPLSRRNKLSSRACACTRRTTPRSSCPRATSRTAGGSHGCACPCGGQR